MNVKVAEKSGFCFGVRRAIDVAKDSLRKYPDVFVKGDLIHNRQIVELLEEKGMKKLDSMEDLKKGDILVIRSHGEVPEVIEEAEKKGITVVDTTCHFVKKAQSLGSELAKKEYQVIIIGKPGHPEVSSLAAHSNTDIIISCIDEIDDEILAKKVGVISQTTFPKKGFDEITTKIKEICPDVVIHNTICSATTERQKAALNLAKEVDAIVVIGGYNSSNTGKLAELCSKEVSTYHVEDAEELKREWFNGIKNVGVTAGASTPNFVIEEAIRVLEDEDFKDSQD